MLARESFDDLHLWHNGRTVPAGCSKRPFSKAAASEEARRTLRYVEPLNDARTPLADFFQHPANVLIAHGSRDCCSSVSAASARDVRWIDRYAGGSSHDRLLHSD